VQILSPCVTFRPDQREWKKKVHPAPVTPTADAAQAARRVMTDDGFNIGILYRGSREQYRQSVGDNVRHERNLDQEFLV
jgi:2-oxoglutarate ferredoxin oxidoreductase subunit beta